MKTRNLALKYGPKLAVVAAPLVLLAQNAHAVASENATAAVAQVGTTQADMLLVAAAIMGLAIVLWGTYKLIAMFGKR